jgi:hypothetical protein
VVADMDDDRPPTQSIEDRLVAEANPQQDQAASYDEPEQEAAEQVEQPDENQSFGGAHEAEVEHFDQATHSDLDEEAEPMSVEQELETFKNALKALVRQGIMQRDEAKAAWNARLVALGRAKA